MKFKILATTLALASTSLAVPVRAQQGTTEIPAPSSDQVLNACVKNQAETLPNPFSLNFPN